MTKIFINPGHFPGIDPGAVNPITNAQEANIAKNIGQHLSEMLKAVGYETKICQSDCLIEICHQSNTWGADLFISIHCNGFYSTAAKGTETLYHAGSVNGKRLAKCVHKQIIDSITIDGKPIADRGIKEDDRGLAVLRGTDCPAVLVETAFITNPDEEKVLSSRMGQYSFASAIARGVTDYWANLGENAF